MGYLSQETSVFRRLTVEQNILAILEALPMCRTLGRALTRHERRERTDSVLEQFGLTRLRRNNASRLSGGEKRRLEIARCLVCKPLLILLDEPFTGIDPKTIADIQDIVRDLRKQGIGILLTDHNVREALKITDRSYLIKDGKVRTHGTPAQIVRDPIAISEYLGTSFNEAAITDDAGERGHVSAPSGPPEKKPLLSSEAAIHSIVEQEKIRRLVDRLKSDDRDAAAAELLQRGREVVPALLDALERRDVELRRHAFYLLQNIDHAAVFDPFAPEIQRRQQIAFLRDQFERKAG
jgi:lipopolysaccharide export system ATP-binding protein